MRATPSVFSSDPVDNHPIKPFEHFSFNSRELTGIPDDQKAYGK